MVAQCKPESTALDCGIEFALTQMSDDDIVEIAARLCEHEPTGRDADYLIAATILHGFIVLRQALKLIGEGRLKARRR
jgi:hypothetical protein